MPVACWPGLVQQGGPGLLPRPGAARPRRPRRRGFATATLHRRPMRRASGCRLLVTQPMGQAHGPADRLARGPAPSNSSPLRHGRRATAANGLPCAPVKPTGAPAMGRPIRRADIREPHLRDCLLHVRQPRAAHGGVGRPPRIAADASSGCARAGAGGQPAVRGRPRLSRSSFLAASMSSSFTRQPTSLVENDTTIH